MGGRKTSGSAAMVGGVTSSGKASSNILTIRGSATVVVTLNYRLGLLGFLAHPALDNEGHPFGNYGILDIQEALRWVQRNIAAFGGDPGNVTLGGQSAGAQDTGANAISQLSADLFHQAIYQSSP